MHNLSISIVYVDEHGKLFQQILNVPKQTTIKQALVQSQFFAHHPNMALDKITFGIYSIRKTLGDFLNDQDRIEIYRPLRIDPKDRRRQTVDQKRSAQKWRQELKLKKNTTPSSY